MLKGYHYVYKTLLISTIVDREVAPLQAINVYKTLLISTIVDTAIGSFIAGGCL